MVRCIGGNAALLQNGAKSCLRSQKIHDYHFLEDPNRALAPNAQLLGSIGQ